ncbi:SO2930 family diheme c-type cytochrome [Rhodoflexus sp.]
MSKFWFYAACAVFMAALLGAGHSVLKKYKSSLSEYGFFKGALADLQPAANVLPYDLNTPLFTDYAHKQRFVYIPEGKQAIYNDSAVLAFPIGSVLIKNFYYNNDERKPEKGRRILETRLLIHEESGWVALPYVWNDEQTDAFLEPAGETKSVTWRDSKGAKQTISHYQIPNMNQCKGCHIVGKTLMPIGPSARQLNGLYAYADGAENQLVKLSKLNKLLNLPELDKVPKLANWQDASASLDARARAWLDINCGHCHNPKGPASTSGLLLDIHTNDPKALGIMKTPVAAGKGSGGLLYDIVPRQPEKSILVYRLHSTDPGEMMPELGRSVVHREGLELIREWIRQMPVQ